MIIMNLHLLYLYYVVLIIKLIRRYLFQISIGS